MDIGEDGDHGARECWVSRELDTGGHRESGAKWRVAAISTVGSYCWNHKHEADRVSEGLR